MAWLFYSRISTKNEYIPTKAQIVSKNISLADFVSYQTLYNGQSIDSTEFTIADIASWKDTRYSKEYALICLGNSGPGSGVAVVEVTNPANAVYKKTIRYSNIDNQNAPADVKVYNNSLFVAQGIQPSYWVELEDAVDNLGTTTAGVHTGDLTAGTDIHNMFINKDHELLFFSNFVADSTIKVYDISGVPNSSPSLVGTIPMEQSQVGMRSHDLHAMETGTNQGRVFDANLVSVTVTDYSWNGSTFSVTGQLSHEFNPRRGESPSSFNNPFSEERFRNIHSTWIGYDDDYLFTTVEGSAGSNSYPSTWIDPNDDFYQRANHLFVWDINPINPTPNQYGYRYPVSNVYEVRENSEEGSFSSSYFSTLSGEKANSIHNITTRGDAYGDTAFISYYTKGIRVLDISNPANMSEIAFYDVPGFDTYLYPVYNGTFGVDPFLPSDIILGSSSDGLYVFRKPGSFAGSIDINTAWTGTIKVVDDLTINNNVTAQSDVTMKLNGNVDLDADILLTSGNELTIEANQLATISSLSGVVTIGGSAGGSSMVKPGGSGAPAVQAKTLEEDENLPGEFRLMANYPNPFNPVTNIRYEIAEDTEVQLYIYDILGRKVASLVNKTQPAGTYNVSWDGSNQASGVYIYKISAGHFTETRQMMLVK